MKQNKLRIIIKTLVKIRAGQSKYSDKFGLIFFTSSIFWFEKKKFVELN